MNKQRKEEREREKEKEEGNQVKEVKPAPTKEPNKNESDKKETKETKKESKEEKEKEQTLKEKAQPFENVFIRSLHTGEILRSFSIGQEEIFDNFSWSFDSKFLGRLKKNLLIVYELPSMKMLFDPEAKTRQPLKDNVKNFWWFLDQNIIIILTEKYHKNTLNVDESKLEFYELPSKRKFKSSTCFCISDCYITILNRTKSTTNTYFISCTCNI